jgi:hypothetical protein
VITDVLQQALNVVDDAGLTTAAATLTLRAYWRNFTPVRGKRPCPCGRGPSSACGHRWGEPARRTSGTGRNRPRRSRATRPDRRKIAAWQGALRVMPHGTSYAKRGGTRRNGPQLPVIMLTALGEEAGRANRDGSERPALRRVAGGRCRPRLRSCPAGEEF